MLLNLDLLSGSPKMQFPGYEILPDAFSKISEDILASQRSKVDDERRDLHEVTLSRYGRQDRQKGVAQALARETSERIDEPIAVEFADDLIECGIMLGQSCHEIQLRTVVALEPGNYRNAQRAQRHCQAPFAAFLLSALGQSAAKMGLRSLSQKGRCRLTDRGRYRAVVGVDHSYLNAGQMCQAEVGHRGPASIADPVPNHAGTLRSAKIGIGQVHARCGEGIGCQMHPQAVRVSTPDHVGVEVKTFVERLVFMEIVLETDDRAVLIGQKPDVMKQIGQAATLKQSLMLGRAIKGNGSAAIVPAECDNRGHRMAQIGSIAIAVIDISFGADGH